jgi:DNA-binding MarR family transcriptional regulator
VSALFSRAAGRALQQWNVTWPQAMSLLVLEEQATPISATRLVNELGLGRTAMTSVVDRLERNGWVQRRPSTQDRRTSDLVITPSGRTLVAEIRPALETLSDTSFNGFRPRDLERLTSDLTRLRGGLSSRLP